MASKKDLHEEEISIISSGVKIEGNLTSEGNVRIDGIVVGNLSINGNLTIGDTSEIYGEIKARNITTNGKVEGKIYASEKLKLEPKSIIKGDLITKTLIIEEGAIFEGHSSMNGTQPLNQKGND
ncbi:bactofilin family protein [Rosettibacter firmus]|uniref:bactofilin family protein n=1 Tax=Rosettibacter firmus TaxID=3111522 RepID=UPI00336BBE5A